MRCTQVGKLGAVCGVHIGKAVKLYKLNRLKIQDEEKVDHMCVYRNNGKMKIYRVMVYIHVLEKGIGNGKIDK